LKRSGSYLPEAATLFECESRGRTSISSRACNNSLLEIFYAGIKTAGLKKKQHKKLALCISRRLSSQTFLLRKTPSSKHFKTVW